MSNNPEKITNTLKPIYAGLGLTVAAGKFAFNTFQRTPIVGNLGRQVMYLFDTESHVKAIEDDRPEDEKRQAVKGILGAEPDEFGKVDFNALWFMAAGRRQLERSLETGEHLSDEFQQQIALIRNDVKKVLVKAENVNPKTVEVALTRVDELAQMPLSNGFTPQVIDLRTPAPAEFAMMPPRVEFSAPALTRE